MRYFGPTNWSFSIINLHKFWRDLIDVSTKSYRLLGIVQTQTMRTKNFQSEVSRKKQDDRKPFGFSFSKITKDVHVWDALIL